jgi:low temperature requirement protein LtrA
MSRCRGPDFPRLTRVTDLEPVDEPAKSVAERERHASWGELFFDLVAVAGVSALSHVLVTKLDAEALGLYAVLFLAFWLSWTTFMLYGNVAAGQTHVMRLMVGMFGLGVMAASVPGVTHAVLEDGSVRPLTVFTVAYVATRIYGSQSWHRGEVLLDFPVAQHSLGLLPWVVSFWVDDPWKLALWAVGVGLDLLLIVVVSGDEMLQLVQARFSAQTGGRRARRGMRPDQKEAPVIHGVSVDPAHLAERLGLFVIIVLGESVVQVVNAASGAEYGRHLLTSGIVAFVLLAGMFGLSVVYGYAGLPHLRPGSLPIRAALGLHCLATGVIATVAVSLAAVVEHGAEPLPDGGRWLLCGAVATYFALGLVASVASHGFHLAPTAAWVITGIAIPILLGLLAADVDGRALVAYVALVVLGHLWFERRLARAQAQE